MCGQAAAPPASREAATGAENSPYATVHGDYEIGYFADNRYANEGRFEWRPLGDKPFELVETSGKSGCGHPMLYLRDGKAGNIFVAQLAWSGNWRIHAELANTCVRVGIGPFGPGNMRVLGPGESLRTPEVHFGGLSGDLSAMAQALHAHQRRSVLPALKNKCSERLLRDFTAAIATFSIVRTWAFATLYLRPNESLVADIDSLVPHFAKCGHVRPEAENSKIAKKRPKIAKKQSLLET